MGKANMTPCVCGHYLLEHSYVKLKHSAYIRQYGKCTDHNKDGTLCRCIKYVRNTITQDGLRK